MTEARPFASLSSGLLARKGAAKPAMRRPSPNYHHAPASAEQDDLGWNDMGYDVDPDPDSEQDRAPAFRQNPLMGAIPATDPGQRARIEEVAERLNAHALPSEEQLQRAAIEAETAYDALHADAPPEEHAAPEEYAAPEEDTTAETDGLEPVVSEAYMREEHVAEDYGSEAYSSDEFSTEEPISEEEPSTPLLAVKPHHQPSRSLALESSANLAANSAAKPAGKAATVKARDKTAFTLRLDQERHLKLRLACTVRNVSAQKLVSRALDDLLATMPELAELTRHVPSHPS